MSRTDNLEILEALYHDAQEKLRAMLPILASELDVPVGSVSISLQSHPTHTTLFIHAPVGKMCGLAHGDYVGMAVVKDCLDDLRKEATDASA